MTKRIIEDLLNRLEKISEENNIEFDKESEESAEKLWKTWNQTKTPENLANVMHKFDAAVNQQVGRYYMNPIDNEIIRADLKSNIIKGIESYDPQEGVKLSTHVFPYLKKTSRFVQQHSAVVRVPESRIKSISTFQEVKDQLESKLKREPTSMEMADELSWPLENVKRTQMLLTKGISSEFLDLGLLGGESKQDIMDKSLIFDFVSDLPYRDQLIFEHSTGYYGKKILDTKDLAKKLKITPEKIEENKVSLAKKLKSYL